MRSESTASKSYELNPGRMTYHRVQRTPAPPPPPRTPCTLGFLFFICLGLTIIIRFSLPSFCLNSSKTSKGVGLTTQPQHQEPRAPWLWAPERVVGRLSSRCLGSKPVPNLSHEFVPQKPPETKAWRCIQMGVRIGGSDGSAVRRSNGHHIRGAVAQGHVGKTVVANDTLKGPEGHWDVSSWDIVDIYAPPGQTCTVPDSGSGGLHTP